MSVRTVNEIVRGTTAMLASSGCRDSLLTFVRNALHEAHQSGVQESTTLYSADDVAVALGIAGRTVRTIAQKYSIGTRIGSGNRSVMVFTAGDVDRLRNARRT